MATCTFDGTLSTQGAATYGKNAGGMIGYVEGATSIILATCKNYADITARFYIGGMIGYVKGSTVTLTDCTKEEGTFTASDESITGTGDLIGIVVKNGGSTINFGSGTVIEGKAKIGNAGSGNNYQLSSSTTDQTPTQ